MRNVRSIALMLALGGLSAAAAVPAREQRAEPAPKPLEPREPYRRPEPPPQAASKVVPEPVSRQVRRALERAEMKRRKRARRDA